MCAFINRQIVRVCIVCIFIHMSTHTDLYILGKSNVDTIVVADCCLVFLSEHGQKLWEFTVYTIRSWHVRDEKVSGVNLE